MDQKKKFGGFVLMGILGKQQQTIEQENEAPTVRNALPPAALDLEDHQKHII